MSRTNKRSVILAIAGALFGYAIMGLVFFAGTRVMQDFPDPRGYKPPASVRAVQPDLTVSVPGADDSFPQFESANGMLYFNREKGIQAFDLSAEKLSFFAKSEVGPMDYVVAEKIVFFGGGDPNARGRPEASKGYVQAVDARTGERLWRSPMPGAVWHLESSGGRLIAQVASPFPSQVHRIIALDQRTGGQIWSVERDSSAPEDEVGFVVGRDTVAILKEDKRLLGVDISTGKHKWEGGTGVLPGNLRIMSGDAYLYGPPSGRGDGTVTTSETVLAAFDVETGKERWRRIFSSQIDFALGSGKVFVLRLSGGHMATTGVQLLSLDPTTGETLWASRTKVAFASMLEHRGDAVLVSTDRGVIAYNDSDGMVQWKLKAPSPQIGPDIGKSLIVGVNTGFGEDNSHLLSVSKQTGQIEWRSTGARMSMASQVIGKAIYYLDSEGLRRLPIRTNTDKQDSRR